MKCPFCFEIENKVIDSRLGKEGNSIRRRRECLSCGRRFTTYEYIEYMPLYIIKKDGRREPFSKDKIRVGIKKACEKRKISIDTIDKFIEGLESDLEETGKKEIYSYEIGEKIMNKLKGLDEVAYVRFASVYREFKDVNDFLSELKGMSEK